MKCKTRNGYEFDIDPEDEILANEPGWYGHICKRKRVNGLPAKSQTYIVRPNKNKKGNRQFFHRLIMNATSGVYLDHINGDTLDNRKKNLRFATRSENQFNRGKQLNNTSGYKAVYWNKRDRKWVAQTKLNKKCIYIGAFENKHEAAIAYNKTMLKLFGEFARLNELPPLARLSGTSPCAVQCED